MDINRLNEFITLATRLNYSKAANQLYLTQPALSRHIHDLETTLGAKLFIRDTHNVHLTAIGELFFEEAKEIVARYNHALELVKEANSSTTGELSIGFLGAAVQPFLSQFIAEFCERHPKIKLTYQSDDIDVLTQKLNDDEIDFAFVTHVDKSFFTGVESSTILEDQLVAVVNPNHPLASRESLHLKDLSGLPMISFAKDTNPLAYDFHVQLFKKLGVKYNIVKEISNLETAFFFVTLNEGIFITPSHLKVMLGKLTTIPIEDSLCHIKLNLLWKKNNSNPFCPLFHKEFLSYMQEEK